MTDDTLGSSPVQRTGAAIGTGVVDLLVRRRAVVVAGYLGVSLVGLVAVGRPDRPIVLWWLIGFIVLTCAGAEAGPRRFLIDWVPALVIAAGYDTVRAQSGELLGRAIVQPQLRFDEFVFGGTAPSVQLQRWLGTGSGTVHWWDYLTWVGYLSHFVVTLTLVAFFYVTDRARFRRLAALVVTVSVAGFVTYFIVPAVPPWLASRQGALPPTTRVVHEVWAKLGLPGLASVFNGSARFANPVAALPSLHAAWPLMVLLFIWPTARRGRWVFLAYNVFMVTVLVYGAEHYVSDILLGWCYTLIVFWAWHRYWARHERTTGAAMAAP